LEVPFYSSLANASLLFLVFHMPYGQSCEDHEAQSTATWKSGCTFLTLHLAADYK
jgi:hypothetical protein